MKSVTTIVKSSIELVISLVVMMVLAGLAISVSEYIMATLFVIALMVPIAASNAVHTFREWEALRHMKTAS